MSNVTADPTTDGPSTAVAVSGSAAIQASPPTDRPVRVYADGIYDLFHFGHARSLEQAKKSFIDTLGDDLIGVLVYITVKLCDDLQCIVVFPNTYLLVGCCNDETTHKYKGRTVMTAEERYESLRHCKWVDEVIPDAPWVINQEFLDNHRIDYVAHDSLPYADTSGAGKDVYEFVKKVGRFKETMRTEGISTSDIIMRIVKDYNQYVMRNLDRGYSREDLGEKRLRVNMRLKKLQERVKEQQEKVGEKACLRSTSLCLIDHHKSIVFLLYCTLLNNLFIIIDCRVLDDMETKETFFESNIIHRYADTSGAGKDVYEFVKKVGRFKETMRTEGISTSDIIMRIVKDYNQYVMRNLDRGVNFEFIDLQQEKRLRVNMRLKKLQERVKEQQEKIQTVKMLRNEWVENADRWVAGFLEIFEEGCHKMGTAIRDSIQERLIRQIPRKELENGEDDDTDDQFYEEYFDHDMGSDEDEDERYYDEEEDVEEEKSVKKDAQDNKQSVMNNAMV
ncbi:hypothetical protein F2Q68_00024650 [Brassica cretica]|uniref:choline-phosphate cytidylyltransferase n=1 Tax=Brassica cretica TaxID=69181 RepID=A0A8S9IEW2_BRACR|nr:hypothetical protein F2Q68_00024650 [Brassica cretica]